MDSEFPYIPPYPMGGSDGDPEPRTEYDGIKGGQGNVIDQPHLIGYIKGGE